MKEPCFLAGPESMLIQYRNLQWLVCGNTHCSFRHFDSSPVVMVYEYLNLPWERHEQLYTEPFTRSLNRLPFALWGYNLYWPHECSEQPVLFRSYTWEWFFFYSCLHLFVIFSSEGLNNIFSGFQKDLKIKALFLGHLLFSCISVACGKNISCWDC